MKLICCLFISLSIFAQEYKQDEDSYSFEARVVATNDEGQLLRLKTSFDNSKFLTDRDFVILSRQQHQSTECLGKMVGRSPDYILIKLTEYASCQRAIGFSEGSLVSISSEDLKKNIQAAKTLIEVLLKKRLALRSKIGRVRNQLKVRDQRVGGIQHKYQQLIRDLERKRDVELGDLTSEFVSEESELQELKIRLNETIFKIEKYKVNDHNLKEDRWSLDAFIYNKK